MDRRERKSSRRPERKRNMRILIVEDEPDIQELLRAYLEDAGYQTIAVQIEIFGKLAILVLSMPILTALLSTIREFLS